jgi:adenylylsulfate kinase
MIVLMAGLPGCGKSTLARELAAQTSGAVLDKDAIRAALFAPEDIEYSSEQDDFCQELMLETAVYLLHKNPLRHVFLDGRPFSRHDQIEQVVQAAETLGQPWRILECVCSEQNARRRIEEHVISKQHPAQNRDYRLYLRVKSQFEEITFPKTIIDTEKPLKVCVQEALDTLTGV